jgi:hypothetical protein
LDDGRIERLGRRAGVLDRMPLLFDRERRRLLV